MSKSSHLTVHSRIRIGLLLAALLILALALGACSQASTPIGPVKIATSLPFFKGYEARLLSSIELALDEHNYMAGDIPVELVVLDSSDYGTGGTNPIVPDIEIANAKQIANDPSVVAYVGPESEAALLTLNEAGIPCVNHTLSWPGLTQPGYGPGEPGIYYPTGERTFFRVAGTDEMVGIGAAEAAADLLAAQTVYIVYDDSQGPAGVAGVFESAAVNDYSLEIIGKEAYTAATATVQDFEAITNRVLAAEPDLFFWSAGANRTNATFIATFRQVDTSFPILSAGSPGWLFPFTFAEHTGLGLELLDGIYYIDTPLQVSSYDSDVALAYFDAIRARGGEVGHADGPLLYEATNVILKAIAQAKEPTREGVLEALQNLGDYSGILGTWHFDANGDISLVGMDVSTFNAETKSWDVVQTLIRKR